MIDPFGIENIKNILQLLGDLNLSDTKSYEIVKEIIKGMLLPHNLVNIRKGAYLYRARSNKDNEVFKFKNQISYNPDNTKIKEFGRANEVGQSLFYASNLYETAIFESSLLIKNNPQKIPKETLTLGRWYVRKPIKLLAILNNYEALEKNEQLQYLYTQLEKNEINSDPKLRLILDFFSNEFARDVKGDTNLYKITSAYFNYILSKYKGEISGVMYPSVQFKYNDTNVAIVPDTVDDSLVLDWVGELEVDFKSKEIKPVGIVDIKEFINCKIV
jgi:hypothetical protein